MPFTEWQKGQQPLTGMESHWFDFQLGSQDGNVFVTAPYTSDYGAGTPPWTATLTTTEIGADGQVLSSAVPIATYQTGFDFQTTDAILDNGDRGLFWTVADGTYPASQAVDVEMQRIDGDNNLLGGSVTLVSDVADLEQFRVGSLAGGGSSFVLAYATYDPVSKTEQVRYAGFQSNGTPVPGETGTLDTFSSPGYDSFGFGTLTPASGPHPSFVYLRALANNGSPDVGYEMVGTDGSRTSSLQGVPLTYASGSTNHTLYNWTWSRLDPASSTGNNLVIAAITGDTASNGSTELNVEVRVLTAGAPAKIDDVVPLAAGSTNLTLTQFDGGDFVVGYSDVGYANLREYNNTGDVISTHSFALPDGVTDFKIQHSGDDNLLVAYAVNNATELAYDVFNISSGLMNYRADSGVVRTNLKLHDGDSLTVKAGGQAIGTRATNDLDAILVQAGGVTRRSILDGSFEELFRGAASVGTVVNSSGYQDVYGGAEAIGTVVDDGGIQSMFGTSRNTVLNNGAYQFSWQNSRDYGATLNNGSSQWLDGLAFGTQIKGGDQLVETGGVARSAVITAGDQDVSIQGVSIGTTVNGGTQFVENGGAATLTMVNAGGTFDLRGTSSIRGLVVNRGGVAHLSGDGQTIRASGSTTVVLNGGLLAKDSGSGFSVIRTDVTNPGSSAGHVQAQTGTIEFAGQVTGLIGVEGYGGTTLIFDKTVGSDVTLTFDGSGMNALLKNASDFHGTIAGFGADQTMDLRSILDGSGPAPSFAYTGNSSGGTLTLSDGTHSASLAFNGSYAASGFHLASDGHGGSSISYGV